MLPALSYTFGETLLQPLSYPATKENASWEAIALSWVQVRELDLATLRWRRVDAKGQLPPFRIHSSAAVVGDKWIIHGGRRPGKFNVTNQTFVYNFSTNR